MEPNMAGHSIPHSVFCYIQPQMATVLWLEIVCHKLTRFDAGHATNAVAQALLARTPAIFVRQAFPQTHPALRTTWFNSNKNNIKKESCSVWRDYSADEFGKGEKNNDEPEFGRDLRREGKNPTGRCVDS